MNKKMRWPILSVALLSLCANAAFGEADKAAKALQPLPKDLEIELALSALPSHLRNGATVYVLNPAKGFEVARQGTNEFHAFVARTGDDAFRGNWALTAYRDDILYPVSFDAAGAKANMRVFFDAAAAQARGTPPAALKKTIQERYRTGVYQAPERAGVSYMLSPILRTYVNPDKNGVVDTLNYPHVKFYAPEVSNKDIGGGKPGGAVPFVMAPGDHGYMIQPLGRQETAEVTGEHAEMLSRLCRINQLWCLPPMAVPASGPRKVRTPVRF